MRAPERRRDNPVRLAKAVATLDMLSAGRVMVTFGAGMAPGRDLAPLLYKLANSSIVCT